MVWAELVVGNWRDAHRRSGTAVPRADSAPGRVLPSGARCHHQASLGRRDQRCRDRERGLRGSTRSPGEDLVLSCSCPYFESDGPCKHLWAMALAADERTLDTLTTAGQHHMMGKVVAVVRDQVLRAGLWSVGRIGTYSPGWTRTSSTNRIACRPIPPSSRRVRSGSSSSSRSFDRGSRFRFRKRAYR